MFLNCHEDLTNSECRYIAVVGDVSKLKFDWSVSIIKITFAVEILILLIGLIFSTVAINVFVKSSAIHLNFTRIVIAFTSNFYIQVFCRVVLMLFEIGYFDMQASENLLVLLITSIFHICELACGISYFFGFIIERTFATIFVENYELREMSYISTVLIALGNLLSLLIATALSIGILLANILEIIMLLAVVLLVLILAGVIISIYIYVKNKSYYENAQKRLASTLSTKFQLAENFRIFKALFYIAINFGLVASSGHVILHLVFRYQNKDENLTALFSELFNLQHTIAMVVMNVTFIFSVPAWRQDFHQIISRLLPCIPPPTSIVLVVKQEQNEGDRYFNDLIRSWDNRLPVIKRT